MVKKAKFAKVKNITQLGESDNRLTWNWSAWVSESTGTGFHYVHRHHH